MEHISACPIQNHLSFEKRTEFFALQDEILQYQVERVIITHKDRLSLGCFGFFKYLFETYGTEITVISDRGNLKLDAEEVFEEIVALLHCH